MRLKDPRNLPSVCFSLGERAALVQEEEEVVVVRWWWRRRPLPANLVPM